MTLTGQSVTIARCPEHGLHGERTECFVCGGPVEQIEMVPVNDASERVFEVLRSGRFDRLTVRQARIVIDSTADLSRVPVTRRFYFGCGSEAGHYYWTPGRHGMAKTRWLSAADHGLPWGRVDGQLTPRGREVQGEALLHHKDGWTALAFWDRSVDTRGGCNSVFFFDSRLSFEQALADAREHFPQVFARFDFEVVDVTHA
jgi:hypothetical protein